MYYERKLRYHEEWRTKKTVNMTLIERDINLIQTVHSFSPLSQKDRRCGSLSPPSRSAGRAQSLDEKSEN